MIIELGARDFIPTAGDPVIDWSRCATVPREHQRDGVVILCRDVEPARGRVIPRVFLLADQVGCGKTKQQIDACQIIYEAKQIDTVVVVAPAAARGVWADPEPALGEVAKHAWPSVSNYVTEYSVRCDKLGVPASCKDDLLWLVTNYEFIRRKPRLGPLVTFLRNRKFWLVCDEAWALTSHTTGNWKAVNALRKMAQRVTLINGSPADSPLDLFAQMRMFDHSILEHRIRHPTKHYEMWSGFTHFRSKYAVLKPHVDFPQIIGWQNLEELREKVAPYILRRTTRECWDLPPLLDPVLIEAPMSAKDWSLYRQMRDDMVAFIDTNKASVAKQSLVKSLRLTQITSGFLGGIQSLVMDDGFDFLQEDDTLKTAPEPQVEEIGRAKLDALIEWLKRHPDAKRLLVWAVFRPEIERTSTAIQEATGRTMFRLYGQQSSDDRAAAIRALNPDIPPAGLVGVVGQAQAGGAALNLSGAAVAVRLSRAPSLRLFNQAIGRSDRPGLAEPLLFVDIVATGPKGQRTIDHHQLAALRAQQDIANWTAATWRKKLLEE